MDPWVAVLKLKLLKLSILLLNIVVRVGSNPRGFTRSPKRKLTFEFKSIQNSKLIRYLLLNGLDLCLLRYRTIWPSALSTFA